MIPMELRCFSETPHNTKLPDLTTKIRQASLSYRYREYTPGRITHKQKAIFEKLIIRKPLNYLRTFSSGNVVELVEFLTCANKMKLTFNIGEWFLVTKSAASLAVFRVN